MDARPGGLRRIRVGSDQGRKKELSPEHPLPPCQWVEAGERKAPAREFDIIRKALYQYLRTGD